MVNGVFSAEISRLKQQAKKLGRENALTHAQALDRVAIGMGFANWSLLAKARARANVQPGTKLEVAGRRGRSRYYLHGDQDEADATQYYCARCDFFYEPDHFHDAKLHRGQSHELRYLNSIERWKERGMRWMAMYNRPNNAVNLLAAKAEAMNIAYQASRSPFHRWLLAQIDRDDPVAELAADVRGDKHFPASASSQHEIEAYLTQYEDHVLEAFELAWDEFSSTHCER